MITPNHTAQHLGFGSEVERLANDAEWVRKTRGIVVTAETQAKYDAWQASKNKDIEYSEEELSVVDLSFILLQKVA